MNKKLLEKCISERKSIREISLIVNKGQTTVRYWLKKFNLKTNAFSKSVLRDEIKLRKSILSSKCVGQVLIQFNLDPRGANYKSFHRAVRHYNIDISHFEKNHININERYIPAKLFFKLNGKHITSVVLKKKLFKEKYIKNLCDICKCKPIWRNKILVLRLDHINGNPNNNRLHNLRILCPNCDSQTDTFCRGHKKIRKIKKIT